MPPSPEQMGWPSLYQAPRSAWVCDLGNGQWDHDWQEKHDSSGEVDGGPGDHWTWRECRACGKIETPNAKVSSGDEPR